MLRRRVEEAKANGEPEEVIRVKTAVYDKWVYYMKRHYGSAN